VPGMIPSVMLGLLRTPGPPDGPVVIPFRVHLARAGCCGECIHICMILTM
jgi:hypothetical protein